MDALASRKSFLALLSFWKKGRWTGMWKVSTDVEGGTLVMKPKFVFVDDIMGRLSDFGIESGEIGRTVVVEKEEEDNGGTKGFETAEAEKEIGLLKKEDEEIEGTVVEIELENEGTAFWKGEDTGGRTLEENVGDGVTENWGTLLVTKEAEEKVGTPLFDSKEDEEKLEGIAELGTKELILLLDPNCLELASNGRLKPAKKRTSSTEGLDTKLKPLSDVSLKWFWLKLTLDSLKGVGFFIGTFKTLSTVWKDGTKGELKLLFSLKEDCSKTGGSKNKWAKFEEGFWFSWNGLLVEVEIWYLLSEESSNKVFWTVVINADTTWAKRSLDPSSFDLEWI